MQRNQCMQKMPEVKINQRIQTMQKIQKSRESKHCKKCKNFNKSTDWKTGKECEGCRDCQHCRDCREYRGCQFHRSWGSRTSQLVQALGPLEKTYACFGKWLILFKFAKGGKITVECGSNSFVSHKSSPIFWQKITKLWTLEKLENTMREKLFFGKQLFSSSFIKNRRRKKRLKWPVVSYVFRQTGFMQKF